MDWERLIRRSSGPRRPPNRHQGRCAQPTRLSAGPLGRGEEGGRRGQVLADAEKEIKLPKYESWADYGPFLPMNIERYYDFHNRGISTPWRRGISRAWTAPANRRAAQAELRAAAASPSTVGSAATAGAPPSRTGCPCRSPGQPRIASVPPACGQRASPPTFNVVELGRHFSILSVEPEASAGRCRRHEAIHDHREAAGRHQGGAERARARARPALPRDHVGASCAICTISPAR